jgi:fructose-bisphosphate aldolase class I
MNSMNVQHPWQLSYSYGRALLANALKTWAAGNHEKSQSVFLHRANMNSLARTGDWKSDLELV